MAHRLLIAYDGSAAADAALATAAQLFPGAGGRLLTIVEPPPGPARVQAFAMALDPDVIQRDLELLGRELTDAGREIADRGAGVAGAAGLMLEPHVAVREGSESQTILS